MKKAAYLLFVLVLFSCYSTNKPAAHRSDSNIAVKVSETSKPKSNRLTFTPYKLNEYYTAVDTGTYTNDGPMTGGSYAIIKRNGIVADTIDLSFGLKDLGNDTYLYQILNREIDPDIQHSANKLLFDQGDYVMVKNNIKSRLKAMLPDFDGYFSSPNAIDEKIYYWQLKAIDTLGTEKVSATEYNPLTDVIKSKYLTNTVLETDDAYYFGPPYLEKDSVVYEMEENKKWKFSLAQGIK
jgi:hypothetical protein